jgi:hypothetical protein
LAAETVMQLFGKNLKAARYAYQQFVADGLSMGKSVVGLRLSWITTRRSWQW